MKMKKSVTSEEITNGNCCLINMVMKNATVVDQWYLCFQKQNEVTVGNYYNN